MKKYDGPQESDLNVSRGCMNKDARGIQDLELCEDVGLGLYLRCQTILRVLHNEVECPRCCTMFVIPATSHSKPVYCPDATCGWQTTVAEYRQSWNKRRIWAGKAVSIFETFHNAYPATRAYREKMVLIDTLLHSFHWDLKLNKPNRSAANNLIEGNHDQGLAGQACPLERTQTDVSMIPFYHLINRPKLSKLQELIADQYDGICSAEQASASA